VLVDLRTGSASTLIDRDVIEVRYTPGYLVYVLADGSLQAVGFDPVKGVASDQPVTLATGVALTGNQSAQFAVAGNGTVAYIPQEPRSLVLVNRDGTVREATTEKRNFHAPMFSPDGRRVAIDFNSADGRDVWVLNLADGILSRATFDRDGHDAVWTPDGSALTYAAVKDGVLTLLRIQPGVSQTPQALFGSPRLGYSGVWLPDGTGLVTVAYELEAGSPARTWRGCARLARDRSSGCWPPGSKKRFQPCRRTAAGWPSCRTRPARARCTSGRSRARPIRFRSRCREAPSRCGAVTDASSSTARVRVPGRS
jgi:hypothetical protein